ncbi:hypothetical protein YC2023_011753 [Brassica napus]
MFDSTEPYKTHYGKTCESRTAEELVLQPCNICQEQWRGCRLVADKGDEQSNCSGEVLSDWRNHASHLTSSRYESTNHILFFGSVRRRRLLYKSSLKKSSGQCIEDFLRSLPRENFYRSLLKVFPKSLEVFSIFGQTFVCERRLLEKSSDGRLLKRSSLEKSNIVNCKSNSADFLRH